MPARGGSCDGIEQSFTAADLLADQFLGLEHHLRRVDLGAAEHDQGHVWPSAAGAEIVEVVEQPAALLEAGENSFRAQSLVLSCLRTEAGKRASMVSK